MVRAGARHQRSAFRSTTASPAGSAPCTREVHPPPPAASSQRPADRARSHRTSASHRSSPHRHTHASAQRHRLPSNPSPPSTQDSARGSGQPSQALRGLHRPRSRARKPAPGAARSHFLIGADIERLPSAPRSPNSNAPRPRSSAADRGTLRSSDLRPHRTRTANHSAETPSSSAPASS